LPRNGKTRSAAATISRQSHQCGIHRKSRAKLSNRKKVGAGETVIKGTVQGVSPPGSPKAKRHVPKAQPAPSENSRSP
jgi:hypothetical protein